MVNSGGIKHGGSLSLATWLLTSLDAYGWLAGGFQYVFVHPSYFSDGLKSPTRKGQPPPKKKKWNFWMTMLLQRNGVDSFKLVILWLVYCWMWNSIRNVYILSIGDHQKGGTRRAFKDRYPEFTWLSLVRLRLQPHITKFRREDDKKVRYHCNFLLQSSNLQSFLLPSDFISDWNVRKSKALP